jgi:hypothetical protein
MLRIIGTIGATLAVVAAMATPAAAQRRDGGRTHDRDFGRMFYATTNQNLLLNFTERRPDRVIDAQPILGLGSVDFNPTLDKMRVTSVAGENLRLNVDEGTLLAGDANLNPGTPQIVGSVYTN